MSKQSIRFYHDHEVRAIWEYLKTKLNAESNEVVSTTNQLRLTVFSSKVN